MKLNLTHLVLASKVYLKYIYILHQDDGYYAVIKNRVFTTIYSTCENYYKALLNLKSQIQKHTCTHTHTYTHTMGISSILDFLQFYFSIYMYTQK